MVYKQKFQNSLNPWVSCYDILINFEILEPQLSISQDLVEFIESCTRDQRTSDMWQKLHIGRLTSSLFGDVLKAGSNPNSLIKQIMEGSSLNK